MENRKNGRGKFGAKSGNRFEKKDDGRSGASSGKRFEKRGDEQGGRKFEDRGGASAGKRFGKRDDEQSGRKFGERSGTPSGRHFGKRDDEQGGRKFGERGGVSSEKRFGKRNDEQSGRKFGERGGASSGKRFDRWDDGQSGRKFGERGGASIGKRFGKRDDEQSGRKFGERGGASTGKRFDRWDDEQAERKSGDRKFSRGGRRAGEERETQSYGEVGRKNSRPTSGRTGRRSLCPVIKQCGGCQMLDMEYSEQLKRKQNKLEEMLVGICKVHPIIGMENPFHYRNKVHAVFDRDRRGNIISGIYQENSHIVVPVEKCMIEDKKADEIIGTIRGMLKSFKIRTYDEDTGYGLLRHVLIRRGFKSGEIMVVLVTASPVFPSKNNFVKALVEKQPEITTIVQNINARGTSMVLGDKEHVLYGKGYIMDQLCGCTFRISSKSFYQVNPVQTEKLYAKALELAGLTGKETVVDAYCGIGTIGIIASRKAAQVIGVELKPDAVRDAINNAKLNQAENVHIYCNDAGKFLVDMAERGETADLIIMDPPRSGSTEEFMDSIAKMGARKVVYVSCNPETLANDLKYMKKLGYRAEEAWGVDMFPATGHVETVVLLSQLKADHHIEVDLNLDELDATSAETKATYNEIQQYVLKETGLMVSNLYIAQVKKKCGIEVGESFNKPKSENAKQPKCPTEKEKAIRDALVHFGMI